LIHNQKACHNPDSACRAGQANPCGGYTAAALQELNSHLRNALIRAVLGAIPIVQKAYWQTGKIILLAGI
jgi:hypothetical protein